MAKKLFESTTREEAHKKLEELSRTHLSAECREGAGRYMVWDRAVSEEDRAFFNLIFSDVNALHNSIRSDVVAPLVREAQVTVLPPEVQDSLTALSTIMSELSVLQPEEIYPLESKVSAYLLPWLKCSIIQGRLRVALALDDVRRRVHNAQVLDQLDTRLAPYTEQMTREWFKQTKSANIPQLSNYLTIERIEALAPGRLLDRRYDEKFHILQAPDLFFADMDYYRGTCRWRGLPLIVAFLDIDDFKSFNTNLGEADVDRRVLPRFMAALERHFFARGSAYRFGGDEYAALLPNAATSAGTQFLRNLQERISQVDYPVAVQRKPTISIGFVEIMPDSFLTNGEILDRAVQAKNTAKRLGKNRVCAYDEGPV
ncbi:MAG: GGDEF domain-containing protein [Nitrospira sp.]|nr:GGDEF domain-containing protein [Nitrospira sp.]